MAEDEQRQDDNDNVHDHVPRLRGEHEPGGVEKTPRPGDPLVPLRLEGYAPDHAQHDEGEVADRQDHDGAAADAPLERQHADAHVLEQDRQLEEEMVERVELRDGDADLLPLVWLARLL